MNADCVVGDVIDVLVVNRSGFLEFGLLGCFASLLCGSVTLAPWLLGYLASLLPSFDNLRNAIVVLVVGDVVDVVAVDDAVDALVVVVGVLADVLALLLMYWITYCVALDVVEDVLALHLM